MGGARLFRLHDDEGMTLVEILVASVIMFIILTAVLGLVAQTTAMGMQAKRKTMLTNAVSAYVERVQGMPFEEIGVSTETSGTLEPTYTYVDPNNAEFTITIVPVVEWDGTAPLKTLVMDVTLTDARGTVVQTMRTSVAIRDRAQYLQQASRDPATDPRVRFDYPTPPEGSVVWGESWSEGPLNIYVLAEAQAGRFLESIQVWCDDQWLLENSFGTRAQWGMDPSTTSWSNSSFYWDTLQTEEVVQPDGTTPEMAIIPDGMRTLSVYALDSAGVSVFAIRHLLVDNYAPSKPGMPVAVVRSAWLTNLSWAAAMDGTTPADHYGLAPYRLRAATDPLSPAWLPVAMADSTSVAPAVAFSTDPFSRYWVSVRAESPRNNASEYAGPVIFTSRPLMTGAYSVTQRVADGVTYYRTSLNLAVTPPAFATHVAPVYTWNWVYADGTSAKATTAVPTYTLVGAEHAGAAQPVRAWVDVEHRPYDLASNVKVSIKSNVMGPTPTSGSGTLGEGTW